MVVELAGGLGNQMFQYAAGLALAARAGLDLRVDPFRLAADPKRQLEIDAFPGCRLREAGRWQRLPGDPRAQALARRFGIGCFPPLLHQDRPGFEPRVVAARAPVYLRGYWQSERYFADHDAAVRAAFSTADLGPARARASRLREPGAVAVHVRRGDYASEAATRRVHGLLPRDYYERAVAHVRSRVPSPVFHLFSDDPAFVREAFAWLEDAELASESGATGRAVDDLAAMATCRHHIVANSSYSWWAAWLGASPGQVAVAPLRWYADPTRDTTDLVPPEWHRT
ncbi:MAG TPA: alpha-1,2-fucosyltransferase [Myxococcota bacterium]|nr:alpha-1,2-fucosyltransferase [Myxococcota bacterium]